jgi:hypothetical protein
MITLDRTGVVQTAECNDGSLINGEESRNHRCQNKDNAHAGVIWKHSGKKKTRATNCMFLIKCVRRLVITQATSRVHSRPEITQPLTARIASIVSHRPSPTVSGFPPCASHFLKVSPTALRLFIDSCILVEKIEGFCVEFDQFLDEMVFRKGLLTLDLAQNSSEITASPHLAFVAVPDISHWGNLSWQWLVVFL